MITPQDLGIAVAVGIVVWLVMGLVFTWWLPWGRNRTVVPAIVGGFIGIVWAAQFQRGELPVGAWLAGAVIGAVAVLYIVILVATPGHAAAIVHCGAYSDMEREEKRKGRAAPFVWPYRLVVRRRGSVSWLILSQVGGRLSIVFTRSPFSGDRFETDIVAGRVSLLTAGPVERSGSFDYNLTCLTSDGSVISIDPKVDVPKG